MHNLISDGTFLMPQTTVGTLGMYQRMFFLLRKQPQGQIYDKGQL